MKSIFSLFSIFSSISLASANLPGQDIYDMVIDQIASSDQVDLNRNLKAVFAPAASAVRALQEADCQLLKESFRSIVVIVKDLLKSLTDAFIKEFQFDTQMQMMVQMGQTFVLNAFETQIDHVIEHQACALGIAGHGEEL